MFSCWPPTERVSRIDTAHLTRLLHRLRSGEIGVEDAIAELTMLPYQDMGFARLDHHRALRTGDPEIVFGQSKTPAQIAAIMEQLAARNGTVLCSRASEDAFEATQQRIPHAIYDAVARVIVVRQSPERIPGPDGVTVVSAGTADLPVAEEAALTVEALGHAVTRLNDVGVAGLHRLLAVVDELRAANVLIVVAGMEGALPGVVAGLVAVPVIAVPTSVGYGANFDGIAALLTMLNSCAAGLAVVNIDNGVGAGVMAVRINRLAQVSQNAAAME
jgi:NCAIR mutase (PurE)-related protein